MARQYKKNRARGSRAETYAEKVYLGYSLPKLSDYTTKEEYMEEFIKRNREEPEKSLKKQLDDSCVPIQTISMEHMKAQQEKLETKQYTFNLTKLKEVLSI